MPAVDKAIRQRLHELNAKVGYSSLSCGSDILFAEAVLERGAELYIVLPFAADDFRRTSVDFGQDNDERRIWRRRFDTVLDRLEWDSPTRVHHVTRDPYLGSTELFGFANSVIQGLAVIRARERLSQPVALALVDCSSPGKADGTRRFLTAWESANYPTSEVDLSQLWSSIAQRELPYKQPASPVT